MVRQLVGMVSFSEQKSVLGTVFTESGMGLLYCAGPRSYQDREALCAHYR